MQKAIIAGASSGIGKSHAILLARQGWQVGITGRRTELLESMRMQYPDAFLVGAFDIRDTENAIIQLEQLTRSLGGLDLLILSSGTGDLNESLAAHRRDRKNPAAPDIRAHVSFNIWRAKSPYISEMPC